MKTVERSTRCDFCKQDIVLGQKWVKMTVDGRVSVVHAFIQVSKPSRGGVTTATDCQKGILNA